MKHTVTYLWHGWPFELTMTTQAAGEKQCIRCGASNSQSAAICVGCGQPFGVGPWKR